MPMAPPRKRSPSVDVRRRPERRSSKEVEGQGRRSTTGPHQRDSSPVPEPRGRRPSFANSSRRTDFRPVRASSRERLRPRSRARPSPSRHREVSVSSVKRRRDHSVSPSRERRRKHRRQHSAGSHRSRSPRPRRDDRTRRIPSPTHNPHRRSRSRESVFRKPLHGRPISRERASQKSFSGSSAAQHRNSDRWERGSVASGLNSNSRIEGLKVERDSSLRGSRRKRSLSPASRRHRSPETRRPRSPTNTVPSLRHSSTTRAPDNGDSKRPKSPARRSRSPGRQSPAPPNLKAHSARKEYTKRERDTETSQYRRSSRSPRERRIHINSERLQGGKAGRTSSSRERQTNRDAPKPQRGRSRTPRKSNTPDDKMSWRASYDQRSQPPSRGGWPTQDPRYSQTPPYQHGYQGSPQGNQPSFSPQQSPYPAQTGHPDPNYFNQQGSPFNRPPQQQASPPYQHGSPPNGTFLQPRGSYRGATQASYNQRFPQSQAPQGAGPHVRNLSWTPKTGTRGGHAPITHGAALQAAAESTTPSQEQPNIFNGTDNPFRPASKDLRVDDEAGKTGKNSASDQSSPLKKTTETPQQQSPQIRFGLPKTGVTPAVVKPNAFVKKRNPFERPAAVSTSSSAADRQSSRSASQLGKQDEQNARPKGPKGALKQPERSKYHERRRPTMPVHWNPLPHSFGDKELGKKLRRLRSIVISKGHSLNDLQWDVLKPPSEPIEDDDPPGLVQALANMALLEEDAYRDHPDKRPRGKMPLLRDGEVLDKIFTKDVVAVKYKIRRPQKILPEEYRSSNVYYRKPGNESVVGFGTYGKVFKAKHIYKGKDVALKRLRMEAEKDGFPITAMREMKILKHLEQREADGVIRLLEVLYEVNLAGSVGCFMAFEYMPHDLTGLLNHPTFSLSDAQKKDLSYQTVDAIGFMHRQGVLHRDIKAANILVSHKGQIKLADFGLARFYDMDKQLHYTNRVVTIWYRAPELLYGQTEYGPPIDVWAAACVIVEIFTKHAIFPGSGRELNQLMKLWEVLGFPTVEEWPEISKTEWYFMMRPKEEMRNVFAEKYQHRLSPELFDLLGLMLKYDPAKRPTAEQCLEHAFFTQEGPERTSVTELEELGDWHELESKRARKQREADDRTKKELEHDFLYGPPSCGQHVAANRKDRDYLKLKLEKRVANFSPVDPVMKKVKM